MTRSAAERTGAAAETPIRRIVVAVDASRDSLAALEAAAELAAGLGAELRGLFVEEEAVVRADKLTLSREVEFFSAESRPLETGEMERQLQAQARRVRRVLEEVAERRQVRWSFRRTRGRVASELREAAKEADLLALGVVGRSLARGPGSTVRELLGEPAPPMLLMRRGARVGRTIHVLYDASSAARTAVRVAAALSRQEAARLTVSVLAVDEDEARARWEEAREELEAVGARAEYHHVPVRDRVSGIAGVLRARGCGLLVAPRPAVAGDDEEIRELLREISCPLVVVG